MSGEPNIALVPLDATVFREHDIEVWRIDLDASRDPAEDVVADLNEGERERLARFLRVGDRARFAILRSALRRRLGALLGLPACAVPIRIDLRGKPRLSDDCLRFNLAHSGDHGIIVLSRIAEVGIDIEREREFESLDALAEIILSVAERPIWLSAPSEDRHALFLRAWTAKEAVLKAVGSGLLADPKTLTVLGADGALCVRGDPKVLGFGAETALVQALPAPRGYACALALISP